MNYPRERGTYALVDSKGKIIDRFRLKEAARDLKRYHEKRLYCKLEIVKLKY